MELSLVLLRAGLLILAMVCTGTAVRAAPAIWEPSAGRAQVPIWPGMPPDQPSVPGPETVKQVGVTNVTRPTMTAYPPSGKNTGVTVVVIPGGGFQGLAMDLEGTEICDWLTSRGVTCVLLKYRVPSIPYVWQCDCRPHPYALSTPSLEDVQRTLRLVRAHAGAWRIDPHKVGVIGFSAGGFLVAEASTYFSTSIYAPVDAADQLSSRPDFAIAVYPGHLSLSKDSTALNPVIESHITAQTPPTFLLQNEDDHVDQVEDALSYYMGLKKAGVPVELHAYAQGGHAFGLRATNLPVSGWPQLVETWLHTIGVLGPEVSGPFRSAGGAGASAVPIPGLDGTWEGTVHDQTGERRLVLHISTDTTGTSASLDSPGRGVFGLPIEGLRRDGQDVAFTLPAVGTRYSGSVSADGLTLKGEWVGVGVQPTPAAFARTSPTRAEP